MRVKSREYPFGKSLLATGVAPSVLDDAEDSLLPGFIVASLPAPVPKLRRLIETILSEP
jgi:hypothetical protein